MMHMKLLERKKPMIEAALSEAFACPGGISMAIEGEQQQKKLSDTARDVINQAYDVFGREKIDLTE